MLAGRIKSRSLCKPGEVEGLYIHIYIGHFLNNAVMLYVTYYSMICKFDIYLFHHMNNKNIKTYLVNPRFQGNVEE